ncbi:hypothetical protein [Kineococcus sp. SYSU DK002]|uniref:hypothetical protein n=1 Tax=Kineococcus sp. SYSU DK002 TaxID=3383123 RepID=UPI003D7CCC55
MSTEPSRSGDRLRQRDDAWRRLAAAERDLATADGRARLAHGSLAEAEFVVWAEEQRQLSEHADRWWARLRLRHDQRRRLRRVTAERVRREHAHEAATADLRRAVQRRDEAEHELRSFDAL